jgi:hypothetical protein
MIVRDERPRDRAGVRAGIIHHRRSRSVDRKSTNPDIHVDPGCRNRNTRAVRSA